MTKKLSDREKALIILEKASEEFNEYSKTIRELHNSLFKLTKSFENASNMLKRSLNEEQNGNIHKECEYYNAERDYCANYLMGTYTGLAFEVSRHPECIKDMVEE